MREKFPAKAELSRIIPGLMIGLFFLGIGIFLLTPAKPERFVMHVNAGISR